MPDSGLPPVSLIPVDLPRRALRRMLQLVRLTYALSRMPGYQQMVLPHLPEVAQFDPGHAGLMMGYDFHLNDDGPHLIEVNTNAGGGYLGWLAHARFSGLDRWQPPGRMMERLRASFLREWNDFTKKGAPLRRLVIVDEEPEGQPLFKEMCAIRDWLRGEGVEVEIAAPEQLQAGADGVRLGGEKVDLVYNRHCDFFLETELMAGLRAAYVNRSVCLSPHPFVYGLLADKRRMVLWSDRRELQKLDLSETDRQLLLDLVPHSRLLADCDPEEIWQQRKELVFKPVTRFGSRGVLMGKSISRRRFAEQDPETTLVQKVAPPGITQGNDESFKTDLRLFVYRNHLLGVSARLYQGQVTNLRTAGGGFAPVRLT